MVEGEEKDLVDVENQVRGFAYAIAGIQKAKSKTFDLMAENAIKFYLSNQRGDGLSQIISAIEALFYFLSFAIAHPVLTNKLAKSLRDLKDGGKDQDIQEFAIKVMRDENVWKQIVDNENLRPNIISALELYLDKIANMSFDERKALYDGAHSGDEVAAEHYTQDMYNQEKAAAKANAEIYKTHLGNAETVRVALSTIKALMTNDKVNKAIIGYIKAEKGIEEGPITIPVLQIIDAILDEGVVPAEIANITKVINVYISTMDMSAPGGDYSESVLKLLENKVLWEKIINNPEIKPHIISIVETYLNKVANMSFDECKIVYERTNKDAVPYTQDMYNQEKAAAENAARAYPALLRDSGVLSAILELAQFVVVERSGDVLKYIGSPASEDLLPGAIITLVIQLIEGDKLKPLIANLDVIFKILSPNNFVQDAPEFGEGVVDKSLLELIHTILKADSKLEFIKAALPKINEIVAKFRVEQLFAAVLGVVDIIRDNPVLSGFVEGNSSVASKIVRYMVRKNFEEYCTQYGVVDEFWGVLDIVLKDLGAARGLISGLVELTNGKNYETGAGIEKAVDTFVRELVNILNHPSIGPGLRQFIGEHKGAFISLIDGVMDNIPAAKPYITQYVLGLGLTFSDVLDQVVHNPNDLIKLLDIAKDSGALRGEVSAAGLAVAVKNKWTKGEGLGIYSPAVQQVIAEVALPYVPQIVIDWTPQWFKNYVPGGTAKGDRRGADFTNWVVRNLNEVRGERLNLHDVLVQSSKVDKNVTDEAREFINYNALSKLNFGGELRLHNYVVQGFSFAGSQANSVSIDNSVIRDTNFNGMNVRGFEIYSSELRNVDFSGLKFVMESRGYFYNSMVTNPTAVLTIRNSHIDKASLKSLKQAAKDGPFKLKLIDVSVILPPVAEVSEGEKLMDKCAKESANIIIKHLKSGKAFMDEGLGNVLEYKDEDLRVFLEEVMKDAFSRMPQENLMYFRRMDVKKGNTVLIEESFIDKLDSVYSFDDDKEVGFLEEGALKTISDEVLRSINDLCNSRGVARGKIESKTNIVQREQSSIEIG